MALQKLKEHTEELESYLSRKVIPAQKRTELQ